MSAEPNGLDIAPKPYQYTESLRNYSSPKNTSYPTGPQPQFPTFVIPVMWQRSEGWSGSPSEEWFGGNSGPAVLLGP